MSDKKLRQTPSQLSIQYCMIRMGGIERDTNNVIADYLLFEKIIHDRRNGTVPSRRQRAYG